MPKQRFHNRPRGSTRQFKDGEYKLIESVPTRDQLNISMDVYKTYTRPGQKLRYAHGSDGFFHIYAKAAQAPR